MNFNYSMSVRSSAHKYSKKKDEEEKTTWYVLYVQYTVNINKSYFINVVIYCDKI